MITAFNLHINAWEHCDFIPSSNDYIYNWDTLEWEKPEIKNRNGVDCFRVPRRESIDSLIPKLINDAIVKAPHGSNVLIVWDAHPWTIGLLYTTERVGEDADPNIKCGLPDYSGIPDYYKHVIK